jgi:signal transduction histidine kinase
MNDWSKRYLHFATKSLNSKKNWWLILGSCLTLMLTWLFYATPVRVYTEDFLFDLRTKIKPDFTPHNQVVLVEFGDEYSHGSQKFLSLPGILEHIERNILPKQPSLVFLSYFSNLFDYQEEGNLVRLSEFLGSHPNVYLMTLKMHSAMPSLQAISAGFLPLIDSIVGADLMRKRSNTVLRSVPRYAYLGKDIRPMFAESILRQQNNKESISNIIVPNYFDPEKLIRSRLDKVEVALEGKIVILGYRDFRAWPNQTNEPLLVNTPAKGKPNDYFSGEKIINVLGIIADNITNQRWLRAPHPIWAIIQSILVSFFIYWCWAKGSIFGSIGSASVGLLLLAIHATLMETASLLIPLADTFLFGSITLMGGAFVCLNREIRSYIAVKTQLGNELELSKLQGRFLDQFADEVASINRRVMIQSTEISHHASDSLDAELVSSLRSSAVEFDDFLSGIKQVAQTSINTSNPSDARICKIAQLCKRIAIRFEHYLADKNQRIVVNVDEDLSIRSHPEILDTIIYNFVANSVKYAPNSEVIEIYAYRTNNAKIRIGVKDAGPGIPDELQSRIFEKFYRINEGRTHTVKGSGIGLYLAKFFATKIGAHVNVHSSVGIGSDFYLEILE